VLDDLHALVEFAQAGSIAGAADRLFGTPKRPGRMHLVCYLRQRSKVFEPPIGVMDLPAMIVFDDVMLGSGGWGCSRRVLYSEHRRKAHCGEHHQSDGHA
jgi:hypothetical protein